MFKTDHVAISVMNLPETLEFYKWFGFEVFNQYEADNKNYRIVMLTNKEGKYIEIFHYTDYKEAPDYIAATSTDLPVVGTKHMSFRVTNLDEAAEFVLSNHIAKDIKVAKGRLGRRYFFVKDPNGILIEIIEEQE